MRKMLVLMTLAAALVVAAGCSGGGEEEEGAPAGATAEASRPQAAAGGGSVGAPVLADKDPAAFSGPALGPKVIQTASVRLSVPRRQFDETVDEARSIVGGLGGFVVSSSASQGQERRLVGGTLVMRVPARSYAEAMKRLTGLGRVERREESGQDVSQEFVDLEARARHLEAVETQLLELLDKAETVAAALAVQSKLNQVQLDLEQTRGRLRFLDDQVSFATISMQIHERLAPAPKGDGGWSIVDAWKTAANGFLAVVGWLFVALATAAPVLVLLALAFAVWRIALRRRMPPLDRPVS